MGLELMADRVKDGGISRSLSGHFLSGEQCSLVRRGLGKISNSDIERVYRGTTGEKGV